MKRTCSIVTALIMAFTIFAIPTWGVVYADDEVTAAGTETTDGIGSTVETNKDGNVDDQAIEPKESTGDGSETEPPALPITDFSYTWISIDTSETAASYSLNGEAVEPDESGKITGLKPNTEYVINALDSEGNVVKSATLSTKSTVVPAPSVTPKVDFTAITYDWSSVADADGYAYRRGTHSDQDNTYRNNSLANLTKYLKPTSIQWYNLRQHATYTFNVCAYKIVPDDELAALADETVKINTADGELSVLMSKPCTVTATTKYKEKMTRKKFSKGYYYSYYRLENGKWVKEGTSYDMWRAVQNAKSKTKYLIALDIRRNNVIVYKGKKGNWKVYKHFVVATGKKGKGTTAQGTFKIFKRKIKFATEAEHSKVGKKYTCWYASRWRGGLFFHSVLYQYNSKKKLHDGDVGCDKSHGCVRMKLGDAKWIYKNCKNGTAVVSSKKWTKHCSYGIWDSSWK